MRMERVEATRAEWHWGTHSDSGCAEIGAVSEGKGTNNIAEYRAAVEGVKRARARGTEEVELRTGSELLIKQLNEEYRVKKEGLKLLWNEFRDLLASFGRAKTRYVPREQNQQANELTNAAF